MTEGEQINDARVGQLWMLTASDGHRFEALCAHAEPGFASFRDRSCTYKHWHDSPGSAVMLEERGGGESPPDHIAVWPWAAAPVDYRSLSQHGGDEEWVVFVPGREAGAPATEPPPWPWLASMGNLEAHRVFGGTVYIGAHS